MKQWLALLILSACSTMVRQDLDLGMEYRKDIELDVRFDGKQVTGRGVLVLPQASLYEVRGKAAGDFDFLAWQTCAQQHTIERRDNDFKFLFSPVTGKALCNEVLEIRGVEEVKGRNQGAIIAFDDSRYVLRPEAIVCNGKTDIPALGVSVCQAKEGLVQSVDFSEEVLVSGCGEKPAQFTKRYVFRMPQDKCPIVFGTKDNRRHLLLLFPYKDIVITRKAGN